MFYSMFAHQCTCMAKTTERLAEDMSCSDLNAVPMGWCVQDEVQVVYSYLALPVFCYLVSLPDKESHCGGHIRCLGVTFVNRGFNNGSDCCNMVMFSGTFHLTSDMVFSGITLDTGTPAYLSKRRSLAESVTHFEHELTPETVS